MLDRDSSQIFTEKRARLSLILHLCIFPHRLFIIFLCTSAKCNQDKGFGGISQINLLANCKKTGFKWAR
jgi:hypothetical protein